MKWSIRLGTLSGIGVYMHLTFLLLLAWWAYHAWSQTNDAGKTLIEVLLLLAIFGCVVLHELGHALMARRFGIRTRDITLLPIGGLARLERMPDDPKQELWVALAGPAVNVLIAAALSVWLVAADILVPLQRLAAPGSPLLQRLLLINIFLVVFNLIPAFPMDGGRVLRAMLATQMEYTRATQIAAVIGQGFAFLFGFIGLLSGYPLLLFIALFVWIGAAQESSMVQMKTALSGIPVGRAMVTEFEVLAPDSPLAAAVELTLRTAQKDYPVIEDGRLVGILTQSRLLAALSDPGPAARVADVMEREFQEVDAHEMLETALARLQECACRTLPVFHHGRLVGLVTTDNVGEFISIQSAIGGRGATPGQPV